MRNACGKEWVKRAAVRHPAVVANVIDIVVGTARRESKRPSRSSITTLRAASDLRNPMEQERQRK
jgi:hypothetical protein